MDPFPARLVAGLAGVDGALAASVFHKGIIAIPALKRELADQAIDMRLQ